MKRVFKGVMIASVFLASLLIFSPHVKAETFPQIVSVASDGSQGDGISQSPSVSSDGRYIAFSSEASNLVSGDTNETSDIFVHDRQIGETARVSVASDGAQANGGSWETSLSADGRYVAFWSAASNLVPDDTNGVYDMFVHDRQTGVTSRISVASDGTQGNETSYGHSISADGRYVAFWSAASNLVPDDTNGKYDIFVHDRQTSETSRVSVSSNSIQANDHSWWSPSISADGRYVSFSSRASNLVVGDTGGITDAFVYDRQTGETSRVSVSSGGIQGNGNSNIPIISSDGHYAYFSSTASNLVPGIINQCWGIFVHNRQTSVTDQINVSPDRICMDWGSSDFSISSDRRYITFSSVASNLVSGDTNNNFDSFIYDLQTSRTSRVSITSNGAQVNGQSNVPIMSAGGRYLVFDSFAANLIPGDTNGFKDIFITQNPFMPVANAGLNQTVLPGSVVTLDGSQSTDPNGDYPLTYSWSFVSTPNGSNAVINNPTSFNPTFIADGDGIYVISLVVADSTGSISQPAEIQISTTNTPPVADAGVDQLVTTIGSQVTLDGSNSYDVDGDAISYHWSVVSQPNGSDVELSSSTAEKPTFTADVHGDYIFSLTVSDNWSASVVDQITVGFDNIQPVANAGGNQAVVVGDTVNLSGSGSTDANGDNLTYKWNIVSKPEGSNATLTSTDNVNTSFTADTVGQYVINLIVNDGFIDSTPSVVNVVAISHQDAATQELTNTVNTINDIPVVTFNNPNNVNALTNKINAALANISSGNYADALNQLQNDILQKTNGCAVSSAPDNNDWITTENKNPTQVEIQAACNQQAPVYSLIMQAIGYLESLI